MNVKKKYFSVDYIWFFVILALVYLKLTFSYLQVEHSYWIRHLPTNYDTFNFLGLPQNFSSNIEFILTPLLLLYILVNLKYLGRFKTAFLVTLLFFLLNIGTSFLNDKTLMNSFKITLKIVSPIYFFLSLLIMSGKRNLNLKNTIKLLIKYSIFLVIIGLLFFEISMNRMEKQLPIFFLNIHTQGYIITAIFIGISYFIYKSKSTLTLLAFLIGSFAFLYFGYAVRTAVLCYLIYILGLLYVRHKFFKFLWVQLVVFIPLIVLGVFLILEINYDRFSSGRLTMYGDKFAMLKSYSFMELLLGRGAGSDLIRTEAWWYAQKNSHSDFLTLIVENGVLYFTIFMGLILSFLGRKRRINIIFLALILAYLLSSMISNGIAVRPLAGYMFFGVLAYIYNDIYNKKEGEVLNE